MLLTALVLASYALRTLGHASIWHPSIYGFNVTDSTFPYDNRPVTPLINLTFDKWWFHGHLDYPPNPGDYFELPVGQVATAEIACNKGATSFFASSEGGNIQSGNDPCPGSPPSEYHTTGLSDVKGCALGIAYKSDVQQVQPEDFAVFSVNHTCVWDRFTDFPVPSRMPPCPDGGCLCAWFWIHSVLLTLLFSRHVLMSTIFQPDSGSEQNYMTGFKCNVTGATSAVPIAQAQVPRRCGADPDHNVAAPTPGNCTYGAKQPFYWFQAERNNMFEDTYAPPFYTDLYNFKDGAQDDIFADSYLAIPPPSPTQTTVPTLEAKPTATTGAASSLPPSISPSQMPVPTGSSPSGSSGSRMCKLQPQLHSQPSLSRRSILPGFMKNVRSRRSSGSFSLFHPF